MAVSTFSAVSGNLTDNIDARLVAGISTTGAYTYSSALTPGVYTCKTKSLSSVASLPSVAITLGTSGTSIAVPSDTGAMFKVNSTESNAVIKSYTSNFSSTVTAGSNEFASGLKALYAGSTNGGTSDVGWKITAYNPTTGVYVGGDSEQAPMSFPFQQSTDLKTWTDITIPTLNGSAYTNHTGGTIHWINNKYVYSYFDNNVSYTRFATSPDLVTWTYAGSYPEGSYYLRGPNRLVYLNGYYYAAIESRYAVYRSTDLATWTSVLSTGGENPHALVSNGSSIMVSAGSTIYYSTTGTSWTSSSPGSSAWYWADAQPGGDYMFLNSNGYRVRYNSSGAQIAVDVVYNNYFSVNHTNTNFRKLVWHVDKFYMLGKYEYSGKVIGIWPITNGTVNYSPNAYVYSESSNYYTSMLGMFSDGTSLFTSMHSYGATASADYWHNYSIVKRETDQRLKVVTGTVMPTNSTRISRGSTIIKAPASSSARHIEYSQDGGLNWYVCYLDSSSNGTNLINFMSPHKNIHIDADGGFTAFGQTSNAYVYALRAVRSGLEFSFGLSYITSTGSVNSFYHKMAEGVYAFGYDNMNIYFSTNYGVTWTNATMQTNNNSGWGFHGGLYNPIDGMYYAFTGVNSYYVSANLTTWTSAGSMNVSPSTVYGLLYGNKIFTLYSANAVYYSTDMKTWVQAIAANLSSCVIAFSADGLWSISGQGSTFKVSSDGKNYKDIVIAKPTNFTGIFQSGYYNGSLFYIGTDYKEKNRLRLTEPNTIFELYKMSYEGI